MKANAPKTFDEIFGEPLPPEVLAAPRMPRRLIYEFGSHSSQTDGQTIHDICQFVDHFGSPRQW
jgi:hypothetical protein